MEDDHIVYSVLTNRFPVCKLYGLYDGHGGRDAVDFAMKHLHKMVEKELCDSEAMGPSTPSIQKLLSSSFLKLDRMLANTGCFNCGTTAVLCLCCSAAGTPPEIHVANVGDSRCLLVSDRGVRRLTMDHLATDEAEALRVQRDGGQIICRRVGGTLALTRALGDHSLKGPGGGVTAEPHYVVHRLEPKDRFLLLASDGLWDVISDEEAHQYVLSWASEAADEICMRLVNLALERGTRDNVSAMVVRLQVKGS